MCRWVEADAVIRHTTYYGTTDVLQYTRPHYRYLDTSFLRRAGINDRRKRVNFGSNKCL